jgi:hypothetical protein
MKSTLSLRRRKLKAERNELHRFTRAENRSSPYRRRKKKVGFSHVSLTQTRECVVSTTDVGKFQLGIAGNGCDRRESSETLQNAGARILGNSAAAVSLLSIHLVQCPWYDPPHVKSQKSFLKDGLNIRSWMLCLAVYNCRHAVLLAPGTKDTPVAPHYA